MHQNIPHLISHDSILSQSSLPSIDASINSTDGNQLDENIKGKDSFMHL